jgi:hypothetical protein
METTKTFYSTVGRKARLINIEAGLTNLAHET